MIRRTRTWWVRCAAIVSAFAQCALAYAKADSAPGVTSGNPLVTVRLYHGIPSVTIQTTGEVQAMAAGPQSPLAPGVWKFVRGKVTPPAQRYHVFAKTFRPGEEAAMQEYAAGWKAKGYDAEPVLRGDRYATADGQLLDGRQYWVSLARGATEREAQQIVKRLQAQGTWAWVRAETTRQGSGVVTVHAGGRPVASLGLPLTLRSESPIAVKAGSREGRYLGSIELRVGPDAQLDVFETLPLEDYLAGVLPAEMPAEWPLEALEAQAITARSDVLEHLGFKHILEGYHFTNSEGDRVYAGAGGRKPATDAAVADTRGQVLVAGGRIVPAVFCSNCGGWTEDNEAVWSSPPNPALRGVSDLSEGSDRSDGPGKLEKSAKVTPSRDIARWLAKRPAAYCAGDEAGFRWTRRYTAKQLDQLVARTYGVGHVTAIQAGERGVSGRLKSVAIRGTKGTVTVRKELPIRQAFGDLPSAVLIIKEERGRLGVSAWTFAGGGRGHGVGLCQHGARGMALEGLKHDAIVKHYFSGSSLANVR